MLGPGASLGERLGPPGEMLSLPCGDMGDIRGLEGAG